MIPKFRAWDSVEKKFVEHFFITDNGLICNMEKPTSGYNSPIPVEKSELILMQSTGLHDKNGKDIFEGDILKVANNDSSWFEVVKYDHDKAMFISKEVNLKYEVPETPLYDLFSPYLFKVEVIGNIWEDCDLIDGKKVNEN
jgi:hypothetical protein